MFQSDLTQAERLTKARIKLLLHQPFFGQIATRLKIIDGSDKFGTMATNGLRLYYNRDFVDSLSDENILFVVCHEVMHCVYQHIETCGGRHPILWNIACDYVINQQIVDGHDGNSIGKMPTTIIKGDEKGSKGKEVNVGLLDERFRGMNSAEVYDILYDENKDLLEEIEKLKQKFKNFDEHMKPGEGEEMSESEIAEANADMKDAIIQATKAASQKAGAAVPWQVKRIVDEWLNPKIDWRQMLATTLVSLIKNDYTYSRINRKTFPMGIALPSQDYADEINITITIDTSGSISDTMIRDFLSEVKGITDQFHTFKIKLFFFDTDTYTMHTFNEHNVSTLQEVEAEGGGGTRFACVWERLIEDNIVPDQLVFFTDGYDFDEDYKKYDKYCDTIFVVTQNDEFDPGFGIVVNYDLEQEHG